MGGCQNYGPFLDPHYNRAPNISGTQKGTIILTTTHISLPEPPGSPGLSRSRPACCCAFGSGSGGTFPGAAAGAKRYGNGLQLWRLYWGLSGSLVAIVGGVGVGVGVAVVVVVVVVVVVLSAAAASVAAVPGAAKSSSSSGVGSSFIMFHYIGGPQ